MQEPGNQSPYGTQGTPPSPYGTPPENAGAPIPPPVGGGYPAPSPYGGPSTGFGVNDSGTGPAAVLPAELKGFNVGAFLLTWIWAIGHQFWLGLLIIPANIVLNFIPVLGFLVSIGLWIFFGVKGNEWAWQNRKWESVEQFRATQKAWMVWGIAIWAIILILGFVGGVLVAMMGIRR